MDYNDMKSVTQILSYVRGLGADLGVENDFLRFDGPKDALTPELRSILTDRKAELIAFLKQSSETTREEALPPAGEPEELPRTPTERTVAEIWAEVLELKTVGIHANFFDLGGYSRLGAQINEKAEDALGVTLPLKVLFLHPTVASLSTYIDQCRNEQSS